MDKQTYTIWHNHEVVGYCNMDADTAAKINLIPSLGVYFGFDNITKKENSHTKGAFKYEL